MRTGARSNGRSFPSSISTRQPTGCSPTTCVEFSLVPKQVHGIEAADIDRQIQLLIRNLVEIKDTSGEFLLRLPDGRVIDTKGWNDWEWTHGIGLYGILKYYQQTNDAVPVINTTYWVLYVPPNPFGRCNGTVVFQAEAAQ